MGKPKTYVTDIRHFLTKSGELIDSPSPARKLASFLVLIVDSSTQSIPAENFDTSIRCRTKGCSGSIRATLLSVADEIMWRCPVCGLQGSISNWQGTKWDQSQGGIV